MNNRLNQLREIIDRKLAGLSMTAGLKNRVRMGIQRKKVRKKWYYSSVAAAAMAVLLFSVLLSSLPHAPVVDVPLSNDNDSYQLVADKADAGMVATDSGFVLTTTNPTTPADLQKLVVFTPDSNFTIEKKSDRSFYIKPDNLSENTVYNISLETEEDSLPASWAFQTAGILTVISSLPAQNTENVPINTGIELNLSGTCTDISDYFSISPATDGTFEYHGKTAVFVPTAPLKEDTVYTVTLAANLTDSAKQTLKKDYTFSFRTAQLQEDIPYLYLAGNFAESFLPQDPVAISLYTGESLKDDTASTAVYPLSPEQYAQIAEEQQASVNVYLGRSNDYTADTSGLNAVTTFETPLQYAGEQTYNGYVVLPETPAEGHYLVDIFITYQAERQPLHIQKLVQVTTAAIYTQSQNGQTLVWVNDASTGKAVQNAKVTLTGDSLNQVSKTDNTGLVTIETAAAETAVLSVNYENVQYHDQLRLISTAEEQANRHYYSLIYTDRQAYLYSDTIHFWGILISRDGTVLPETVTVKLDDSYSTKVTVNADGSYQGELTFASHEASYSYLSVLIGDNSLTGVGIEIMDYSKPAYLLTLDTDKDYYKAGEQILLTVTGSFYDGTPAKALNVTVNSNFNTVSNNLTLDETGKATITLDQPAVEDAFSVNHHYVSAICAGYENLDSYTELNIPYFPSQYLAKIDNITNNTNVGFAVSAATINYTKIDADPRAINDDYPDNIMADPATLSGNAVIMKNEYVRTESGQYYDFILKKNIKTYDYNYVSTSMEEIPFTTVDGQFKVENLPYVSDGTVNYEAVVTLQSPDGQSATRTISLTNYSIYPNRNSTKLYSLYSLNKTNSFNNATVYFSDDKPAEMQLSEMLGTVTQGTLLYTTVQDHIMSSGFSENGRVTLSFNSTQIPNFITYGAYFDGVHIYTVRPAYCYYQYDSKALNISISTNNKVYEPGETVAATVSITDQNGNPLSANFVLSTVDEAAFAVKEQFIDPLSDLYCSIYYTQVATSASYNQHNAGTDKSAEGGGEGEADGIRRDFADTASFLSGKTDKNGKATVSFSLPDNLTSWRLTAVAAGGKAQAGYQTENITVSVPYFINPVINTKYLTGDDVMLSLRSAGNEISSTDAADYVVTVTGNHYNETQTFSSPAGTLCLANLGKLPAGNYTLLIQGKSGTHSDQMELKIEVVDRLLSMIQTKRTDLSGISTIHATSYPVRLSFYDMKNSIYMDALNFLQQAYGERTDFKAVRNLAYDKLEALMQPSYYDKEPLTQVQEYNQGMKLFSYGQSDTLLTAKLCIAYPEAVNTTWAKAAFYAILYDRNSPSSEVTAAYLGLAALKEPVLYDILKLLSDQTLSMEDQLSLAYALAIMGDMTNAAAWYEKTLVPLTKEQGESKFLSTGSIPNYALTAQAAAFAYRINHSDFSVLMEYVINNRSEEYAAYLDVAAYVQKAKLPKASDVSFSYIKDGKTKTVTLSDGVYFDVFSKEQLEKANFTALSGHVSVCATYTGSAENVKNDPNVTLTKTLETASDGSILVSLSAQFNASAPGGSYFVTDILPTGARFVKSDYVYDAGWYLTFAQGNKVIFSFNRDMAIQNETTPLRDTITANYVIRTALPGKYVLEQATIVHTQTNLTSLSKRGSITLN